MSYYDDYESGFEDDAWMERQAELDDEDVWVNADGATDWEDIETDYLINIVRGLERGKWPAQSNKLERAKEELAGREKKWWQK